MELENNKPEDDIREPIDSSQLSYKDNTDKGESVSRVADNFPYRQETTCIKHGSGPKDSTSARR